MSAPREAVSAEQLGPADPHQRVVDLEGEHGLDALVRHLVERAGGAERRQQAAVAIGGQRHPVRALQQDRPAVTVHRGEGPLHHEAHRPRREPEVAGALEDGARDRVVLGRGEHVPGKPAVARPEGRDLGGVVGEECPPRQRREGVVALGAVEAQTGPRPPRGAPRPPGPRRSIRSPASRARRSRSRSASVRGTGIRSSGAGGSMAPTASGTSAATSSPTRRPMRSRSRPSNSVRRRSRGSPSRRASASARWPWPAARRRSSRLVIPGGAPPSSLRRPAPP